MADDKKPITYTFLNDRDIEVNYQPKESEQLETDAKQIVNAINELKLRIQELEEMLQRILGK